jgi:hypothetical protein
VKDPGDQHRGALHHATLQSSAVPTHDLTAGAMIIEQIVIIVTNPLRHGNSTVTSVPDQSDALTDPPGRPEVSTVIGNNRYFTVRPLIIPDR